MARWLISMGLLTSLGWTAFAAAADAVPDKKGIAFFEKRIRPVLVESCYECHSTKAGAKLKGGLALDSREGLLQGGETGPAIVPGSPEDSLLIEALRHDGLEMPPEKKLPETVIADFVAWVKMGAPDPREGGKVPAARKEIDIKAGRQFWAFQPPKAVESPSVKDKQWSKADVDKFVLAALEKNKLKPVANADRRTWIRRVTLDLVGLIPTPAEVDTFVNDKSPQAARRSSIGCSRCRSSANVGAGTGSTSRASPNRMATPTTFRIRMLGDIATTSSSRSIPTSRSINSFASNSPVTCCRPRMRSSGTSFWSRQDSWLSARSREHRTILISRWMSSPNRSKSRPPASWR